MDGEISAEELKDLIDSGENPAIVDIRSPEAFRQRHIPGSENVPFAELTGRIEEVATDEHVVTVCPHGKASIQAARLIGSFEGFDGRVESLSSGIEEWPYELEADGASTETDEGSDEPQSAPF